MAKQRLFMTESFNPSSSHTSGPVKSGIEIVAGTENWRKRLLWFIGPIVPLSALSGIPLHQAYSSDWLLAAPLVFVYFIFPILDLLIGDNTRNHDEASMAIMEKDNYYKYLTYLIVPIHFVPLVALAWYGSTQVHGLLGFILCGIVAGVNSGLAINTAHEIGHKTTQIERVLSRLALAVPFYGHFCAEHNNGHHRDVATPEDVASSRMGESIYRFMLREVPGALMRGLECERIRLAKHGKRFLSFDNHILQSYAISVLLYGSLIAVFGLVLLPFLALNILFSWLQLSSANYIEHYGLLRDKNKNGRYESCKPHHSWNANSTFSNLALYQLERHSDHHANPTRRYQVLRNFEDVPELPTGYFGMYLVAYIPWLWYRVMDKRVLAVPNINGNFNKVNIDPNSKQRLLKKYAAA